ncbi:MAG: DegT/DnrJ/EryC1/StrS family aminotransferase [bacterium]|nr:DegT/DnrJ/EryC1/StrS family aminotransferase [bacterium]
MTIDTPPQDLTLPNDQESSGRTLGTEEIALVQEAIESGTLTSTKGSFTKTLEKEFAARLGVHAAYAASSGTAAIHCAIAAIDPEPGDEIVTTSITDMGALSPILYQGAIPVFADVDPATCNLTADAIERVLSPKTRAILVTHLFGNPCAMGPIMELANARGIPVIEDCAQAFEAEVDGRKVGTIGALGCFSLQQGKHVTTGEGGIVVSNDPELARRAFLFINKAWGYGDKNPDHYFLALNYRLSELQGAVALAQMEKLDGGVAQRVEMANRLTSKLTDLPGVATPQVAPGAKHTYWRYALTVDGNAVPGGSVALGAGLRERGIACAPRYIQKPAFACQVFTQQRTFGNSRFPFTLARPEAVDYDPANFPGTFRGLEEILVLPWNERFEEQHVDFLASAVRTAVNKLQEAS